MPRNKDNLITSEKHHVRTGLAVLLCGSISGVATHMAGGNAIWAQWTMLAHALFGTILAALLIPYLILHLRRTSGSRRPLVLMSGVFATIAIVLLALGGLHIVLFGQSESTRWIATLHWILGYTAVFLLVMHVVFYRLARRRTPSRQSDVRFPSIDAPSLLRASIAVAGSVLFITAATWLYQAQSAAYTSDPAVIPYEYSYGPHPFRPSQTETQSGKFIDLRQIAGSSRCGTCHQEIFRRMVSLTAWTGRLGSRL